jgi:hypothetical protein
MQIVRPVTPHEFKLHNSTQSNRAVLQKNWLEKTEQVTR